MKVRDIISMYMEMKCKTLHAKDDWSYLESMFEKFLNTDIELIDRKEFEQWDYLMLSS